MSWEELSHIVVEGRSPSGYGSYVFFALPFRCPLDATELEGYRVSSGGRAAVRTSPDRDRHNSVRFR